MSDDERAATVDPEPEEEPAGEAPGGEDVDLAAADLAAAGPALAIRVPASTSNIGPGFDCLGLALQLDNEFTVRPLLEGPHRVSAQGEYPVYLDSDNLFLAAYRRIGELAGHIPPPVEVMARMGVPIGAGLGASGAACVAGAMAANHLLGNHFSREELLAPLIEIEGHPDNVTPSLLGGLTLTAVTETGPLVHVYQPAACWRLALVVPNYALATKKQRKELPKSVKLADAVYNLSRLPLLIDALVAGEAEEVHRLLADRWHEPTRSRDIRRYKKLKLAALEAGAVAVFISGSGPTLGALCTSDAVARRVCRAFEATLADAAFKAHTLITTAQPEGAQITEIAEP